MQPLDTDCDPITPSGNDLLTRLGLDIRTVRDALADDRVRRCPDFEAPKETSERGMERR